MKYVKPDRNLIITEADALRRVIRGLIRGEITSLNEAMVEAEDDGTDDIFAGSDQETGGGDQQAAAPPAGGDQQQAPAPDASGGALPPDKAAPGTNVPGKVTLSKVAATEKGSTDAEDLQEVTLGKVIEKLNAIRSGKSFSDKEVNEQMTKYFGDLNNSERVALYAFLKGLAQIVTGVVPAENATDPGEPPADVKMTKTDNQKTKHVKPNVIHKGSTNNQTQPQQPGQEDTSPPIAAKQR